MESGRRHLHTKFGSVANGLVRKCSLEKPLPLEAQHWLELSFPLPLLSPSLLPPCAGGSERGREGGGFRERSRRPNFKHFHPSPQTVGHPLSLPLQPLSLLAWPKLHRFGPSRVLLCFEDHFYWKRPKWCHKTSLKWKIHLFRWVNLFPFSSLSPFLLPPPFLPFFSLPPPFLPFSSLPLLTLDQKSWLDQSFWPDGLYTAPTDEALAFDLKAVKHYGYNFVRLHQKVNPPRWFLFPSSFF